MNVSMTCDLYITAKTAKCRQNTLDGYISAIRCHVLPKWGERELCDIRRKEVQEWVDSIATAGAATKALKMLQQVFRWAIKTYELEIFDPTSGVELPARPIYRREVMTAKEVAYMLREAVDKPWEANIILAVALGLRPSEALGVDWSDIDWRSGWVHIQRGCHTLQNGETVEYPCKTRLSDRYLKLPRWALVRLRQIRGQRRRGRVRGDLTPRQVYTQYKRFLKSIGLGRCSIEGLRHSWATLAIASGAAIADVSVAMGHTTTRMVIEHYMMSTRAVSKRATDAAGRAIEQGLEAYAMAAQLSLPRGVKISKDDTAVEFTVIAPAGNIVKFRMDSDGVKRFVDDAFTGSVGWQQLSLGRKADRGGTVSDLNTIEGTGFFVGWNNPNAAPTNVSGAHWYVIQSQFDSDWKMQLATSLGGGEIYMRIKNSGAWQSWRAIQLSLGHAGRLFSGDLGRLSIDGAGHIKLWTNAEFKEKFGAEPKDCFIAVSNRASGSSGIFLASPRWNGDAVFTTQMSVQDGVVKAVPGVSQATTPVAYFVAVY